MSSRYVRVYQGPENTNVIGFSASAIPEESDGFEEFLNEKGYEVKKYDHDSDKFETVIRKLGGVSYAYYGIEPPLKPEDERDLARWCAAHVRTNYNYGFLIDNRMTKGELRAFHDRDQRIIAEW